MMNYSTSRVTLFIYLPVNAPTPIPSPVSGEGRRGGGMKNNAGTFHMPLHNMTIQSAIRLHRPFEVHAISFPE